MKEFEVDFPETACEPEAKYIVNRELNMAWDIIENTGTNLFLTGKAGTGKTTFLKRLREESPKRMVVLAPTGVAAINAAGATIHSFFQLPLSMYIPAKGFITDDKKFLRISEQKKRLISSLSLLVIDEISMVRPDVLDAIDAILRRLRNSSLPFGGLQLLLIGDLRQLPPVFNEEEWNILKNHYDSPYFYASKALNKAGFQTIELSVIYRQTDREFIDILNRIRNASVDSNTLEKLNSRCISKYDARQYEDCIRLTTHNYKAAHINETRLEALPTEEFVFTAKTEGNFPDASFPAPASLRLKRGAQVMFVKNDIGEERRYYNGMLGKVVDISNENIIVLPAGEERPIEVMVAEWDNTRYVIDEETKAVKQEKIGTFSQYPLQLAWAITIHKSQGLTFDKALIDAAHSFAAGQTYVALSRCRSLEGLFLESPLPLRAVITDKNVNDFVAGYEANSLDDNRLHALKCEYHFTLLKELFDFESLKRDYADFSRYANEYLVPVYPETDRELENYGKKINKDLCEVAAKFLNSYPAEVLPSLIAAGNEKLIERIKNGCAYFSKCLTELYEFLGGIPRELDNFNYQERLKKLILNLEYKIGFKKLTLDFFIDKAFSGSEYLQVKEVATLKLDEGGQNHGSSQGAKTKKETAVKKEKVKKEKKAKGYSTFETLRLFREGKTVEEIASERGLAETTIATHIGQLIDLNRIKEDEIADAETIALIKHIHAENKEMPFLEKCIKINEGRENNPIPAYMVRIFYKRENPGNKQEVFS